MRKAFLPRWGVLILLMVAMVLSACQGGAGGEAAATGGLEVWLDQPPDGASLPLAAFKLKAHARDVGGPGVQAITFYVNGIALASISTDPTLPLVYAEMDWNPAAPGLYEITAEASNGVSQAGSAVAHVCVGDDCDQAVIAEVTQVPTDEIPTAENATFTPIPSLTSAPTSTPTRAPSATPTTPACAMSAPEPALPTNGDAVNEPNPTLSWTYASRNCQPEGYRIEVCSDEACASVVQSGGTGSTATEWSPATALEDCSIYYWRVAGVIGTTVGPYSKIFHFATAFPGGCGGQGDTTPPNIRVPNAFTEQQMPTFYGSCGTSAAYPTTITFVADVRDDSGLASVTLNWRYRMTDGSNTSDWRSLPMSMSSENNYTATFDNNSASYFNLVYSTLGGTNGLIEYQITAVDTSQNTQNYNGLTQIGYCIG